jgi:lipopolysaccharide export system protein LptC
MWGLKRLLPVSGLVLLAAVVVQTLGATSELSFIVSRDPVAAKRERLRVDGAVYSGEDDLGRPFRVEADRAVQRSAGDPTVEIGNVRARIELVDGPAEITAPSARYALDSERLTVDAPVMARRTGLVLTSGTLAVDLRGGRASASGPIAGDMALGRFEAGALDTDLAGERVVLSNGARLRIARGAAK